MVEKVKGFVQSIIGDTKKSVIAVIVVIALVAIIATIVSSNKEQRARQEAIDAANARDEASTEATEVESNSSDVYLLQIQEDLKTTYGPLPDGYLWETDGSLLSLGDPSMTAEEVVYAYLNGVRSLDLSMAQKYSRRSFVVNKYEAYFNSNSVNTDYTDSFYRNMYKEVMLSIQPLEIIDTSVFAENKQVFTMKVNTIDLSSKDFWLPDKDEIYKNLYIYSSDESDSTKSENYIYDYVLNYYRSGNAVVKDTIINLTVERFPDLNTGWLVSIDKDIDDLCSYADGNVVVNYIRESYNTEGRDKIQQQRSEEATTTEEGKKKKKKKNTEETSTELTEEASSEESPEE